MLVVGNKADLADTSTPQVDPSLSSLKHISVSALQHDLSLSVRGLEQIEGFLIEVFETKV